MTDKLIKIFKYVVLAQMLLLGLVAGVKYLTPDSYAAIYRAFHSEAPESFIITVIDIDFVKEDGTQVSVWHGEEDVDLMSVSSLADVKTFNVDVPAGTYKQFGIHFKRDVKVKGSVTVGGSTYYTKAAHTGHGTGPAELEVLSVSGQTNDVQSFARDFSPRFTVGSNVSAADIHILVDSAEFLSYYDGSGTAPQGTTAAGMYLWNYLPVAISFGTPAVKEVYEYYAPGSPTEKARLTIIYDGNDNPVAASARPSYLNNTGTSASGLTGWLMGGTGAVEHLDYITKNGDGTINIKMYDTIAMAYLGEVDNSDYKLFSNFQRTATQTGNFTNRAGQQTAYTANRIE